MNYLGTKGTNIVPREGTSIATQTLDKQHTTVQPVRLRNDVRIETDVSSQSVGGGWSDVCAQDEENGNVSYVCTTKMSGTDRDAHKQEDIDIMDAKQEHTSMDSYLQNDSIGKSSLKRKGSLEGKKCGPSGSTAKRCKT